MAGRPKSREEKLKELREEYRALTSELADLGFIWQGTVVRQTLTCGKKSCACHQDRSRRHGPYAYWSTKAGGKTVSRLLSSEEASLYEEWIRNRRRLDEIRKKMLAMSRKVAPLLLQGETKETSPKRTATSRRK